MQKQEIRQTGFGLIGILIAVFIMAIIATGTFYATSTNPETGEEESVIERQISAVGEAEKVKNLVEGRDLGL